MQKLNHNYTKLLEAMEFTPDKWEVIGVKETGTAAFCSCGHPIVYNYPIRHKVTGKVIPIGSVCIEHAPFIPIELAHQYKEIVKRLKEEKRQAEQLRQQAIKGELENKYNQAYENLNKILVKRWDIFRGKYPEPIIPVTEYKWSNTIYLEWRETQSNFFSKCYQLMFMNKQIKRKKLKTARGYIKNYEKAIKLMEEFNKEWELGLVLFG